MEVRGVYGFFFFGSGFFFLLFARHQAWCRPRSVQKFDPSESRMT
jgi:hypothetical protein